MPVFSFQSLKNLGECHLLLQQIAHEVVKRFDCACVCGHRGKTDQDYAFEHHWSEVQYPNSKHNMEPSEAMDLVPCVKGKPSWNTLEDYAFAGYVLRVAEDLGIPIRCGADWDRDKDMTDQTFKDPCHFEIQGVI